MGTHTDQSDDQVALMREWASAYADYRNTDCSAYHRLHDADAAQVAARKLRDLQPVRSLAYDVWEEHRQHAQHATEKLDFADKHPEADDVLRQDLPDATLTLAEAAARLGLARRTLVAQAQNGTLRAIRTETPRGPVWTVTVKEVERYQQESKGKPGRKPAKASG